MRTLLTIVAIVAFAGLWAGSATAQTGSIAVYFDQNWTEGAKDCPGAVLDSCFVVGSNFNAFVSGVNYQINFPGTMTFLADVGTPPITFGSSPTGISMAWAGSGQNGYASFLICSVSFLWNCVDCSVENDPIVLTGHPLFNPLNPQWTDWPANDLFTAYGLTSLVCATVATEETTWGQIKSLYQN